MDQNQTVNNQFVENQTLDNELQKAIDNITNTTNIDPVFSDPVAAPSSVPEGDTGELSEPVGPFPEPKVDITPPTTSTANVTLEAPNDPNLAPNPPTTTAMPEVLSSASDSITNSTPQMSSSEPFSESSTDFTPPIDNLNMHQVKEAALRDLVPLLDHLDMNPAQKFNIYRNMFEELKDYTVLNPAYNAAKAISNDKERAEALFYLVEAIDKM